MPCDTGSINNDYIEILNEINDICIECDINHIILAGDFITDFVRNNVQSKALSKFCTDENFYKCINIRGADVPYTFYSKPSKTYSTIDLFLLLIISKIGVQAIKLFSNMVISLTIFLLN